MGGMVEAIERGYPQKEIAESAYLFQQAVEARERIIVGVNDFIAENEEPLHILYIDESAADVQLARLARVKAGRSQAAVDQALDRLTRAAAGSENTMPPLLDAVRAYATVGEMCDALRAVWGEYEEIPVI
jgi:methylmalonyl-CoA mutase N-terminal domain/subunit